MIKRNTSELAKWLVVLTSTLAVAISVTHSYSMGLFILPLEAEFGWARGEITAGLMVISILSVTLAPFVGMAIDRFGSRRIAIPGIAIYCSAIALLSTTTQSIWHWWAMWALIACGSLLIKPTVWLAAIAKLFTERRGLALALALCGTGLGSGALPLVTQQLIETGGWRFAYIVLGLGGAALSLPLILLFFRDRPAMPTTRIEAQPDLPGLTIRQGLISSQFWRMAIASLLANVAIIGLNVHFVPIMISHGMVAHNAATTAAAIGIASIVGRVGTGYLLDRFNGSVVGAIGFALPVISCTLLLNFGGDVTTALIICIFIGLSLGAEIDIIGYLATRYFGLRNYGTLFGTIAGLFSLGAGIGPTYAGLMFDWFASYDQFLWSLVPVFAVASLLIASLGPYPDFARDRPDQTEPSGATSND